MTKKRRRPSSTDLEDCLDGKLHLIQALDGKVTMDCAGFEVLTAVDMKSTIFWDITPCCPLKVN
jgi:hypothetical protein